MCYSVRKSAAFYRKNQFANERYFNNHRPHDVTNAICREWPVRDFSVFSVHYCSYSLFERLRNRPKSTR